MTIRGGTLWIDSTPTVLWAVSAVIAVIPCTPQRANAFRSAWIPAPPPESEPAIEITAGMRRPSGIVDLEQLDRRSRLAEQVRLLGSPRVLTVAGERLPGLEPHDVNLGQPVGASQPPLQPPAVLVEQREHPSLVLLEPLHAGDRHAHQQREGDLIAHDPLQDRRQLGLQLRPEVADASLAGAEKTVEDVLRVPDRRRAVNEQLVGARGHPGVDRSRDRPDSAAQVERHPRRDQRSGALRGL